MGYYPRTARTTLRHSIESHARPYADVDSTTLTKTLSGGVWNTNLVISLVTGVASSVAASPFDTAKLTAVLWLASVLIDLKDASYDIGSLKDSKLQTGVAAVAAYLAFA